MPSLDLTVAAGRPLAVGCQCASRHGVDRAGGLPSSCVAWPAWVRWFCVVDFVHLMGS